MISGGRPIRSDREPAGVELAALLRCRTIQSKGIKAGGIPVALALSSRKASVELPRVNRVTTPSTALNRGENGARLRRIGGSTEDVATGCSITDVTNTATARMPGIAA